MELMVKAVTHEELVFAKHTPIVLIGAVIYS